MDKVKIDKREKKYMHGSWGDKVFKVIVVSIVILLSLACALPLIHILATSFSSARAITSNEVTFWPVEFCVDAYKTILTSGPLLRSMGYSILITIIYVILTLVMTILVAYPMSQPDLVGKKGIWFFVLFTMYFSGGMIPSYLLISELGLIDSMWSLILPGAISTYNMILMRTFFVSIPSALKEAAVIDGANDAQVLLRIMLPVSKPMLATIALFYGVSRWNAVQDGMLYITDPNKYILQVRLKNIIMSSSALDELIVEGASNQVTLQSGQIRSAALCFSVLPVMLIYPFLQKYFVKGVMIGAVKG